MSDLDYLDWPQAEYVFRLATRCGVRAPKSDADFMRLVYHRPRYTLEAAQAKWKGVLERRRQEKESQKLGDWSADWADCDRCALGGGFVGLGGGQLPADVLIVATSFADLTGDPFDRMWSVFEEAGVSTFRTTLLGCGIKPGTNLVRSVAACMERLVHIARDVRPLTVLALGEIPLRALARKTDLPKCRGIPQWWDDLGLSLIPTWAPADVVGTSRELRMEELLADAEKAGLRAKEMGTLPF